MSTQTGAPDFIIEPFDPTRHDRAGFTCGVAQVDRYFKKTANKLNKADNVRLYVMVAESGDIVGFHAINAHAVDYTQLPERYARTNPGHGSIPAAYISMTGRSIRYRGKGIGGGTINLARRSADCFIDDRRPDGRPGRVPWHACRTTYRRDRIAPGVIAKGPFRA